MLETVRGVQGLADFAKRNADGRHEMRRRQEIQGVVEALRLIYLSPRGVIRLLNDIAEGISPSEEQIAMTYPSSTTTNSVFT